jgi:hypothetical protein
MNDSIWVDDRCVPTRGSLLAGASITPRHRPIMAMHGDSAAALPHPEVSLAPRTAGRQDTPGAARHRCAGGTDRTDADPPPQSAPPVMNGDPP